MKTAFKIFIAAASLAIGIFSAQAQPAYTPPISADTLSQYINGSTTVIPALSTNVVVIPGWSTNVYNSPAGRNSIANTNLMTFNVSEFDYPALTWAFTGTATSTNSLLIYPSYDKGRTFAVVPIWQALNIAPGAADFETNAAIDAHSVTTLAVVIRNTGTTLATNALVEFNLKSPKFGAKEAVQ